jgi:hypothetical protein
LKGCLKKAKQGLTMRKALYGCLLCSAVLFLAVGAKAVDPFDNWGNPKGLYFVGYPLYYNAQEKTNKDGVSDNAGKGITNADLHVTQTLLRLVYYGDKPKAWLLSVFVPVGRTDIFNQHDVGMGDPTFVAGYFFIDDKQKNTYVGLGLKVDMPWGEYDKTRFANMGNNRLRYRPLLSFAKLAGPFDLEALLLYDMRRANKDYQFGGSYDEGDQVQFEGYAGMFLNQKFMPGIHFNYAKGANDKWDMGNGAGFQTLADSGIQNTQLGVSTLWLPTQRFNILFQILRDVSPKNSFKGTLFLSRLAYKFS